MSPDPALEIRHDPAAGRFEASPDGLPCELLYRMRDGVMCIHHTEVDPRLEGRGIAARLVRAAFDWARAQGVKVEPLCSYVRAYVRRHPDLLPQIAGG
ncbi:MAG: GNAT family N-acetyltransferase [Burkholderiaceae bacterium]